MSNGVDSKEKKVRDNEHRQTCGNVSSKEEPKIGGRLKKE